MPLCPADEQMSSEFTPQVTKACGVFVILGLSTTFIRFCALPRRRLRVGAVNVSQSRYAFRLRSWDVFAYDLLPNRLSSLGQVSKGGRGRERDVVFIGWNQESCFRSRRIRTVWLAA